MRQLIRFRYHFGPDHGRRMAGTLLRRVVGIAERAVLRLIKVPLADGPFDAQALFTCNLGAGALQRSTMRRRVNREEHAEVPLEFLKWMWGG